MEIATYFRHALEHTHERYIELRYTGKIMENPNPTDVLWVFNQYYFKMGKFPIKNDKFVYVPEGVRPPLVRANEKISPSVLYEKFQSTDPQGLVAVQFLAALNIFMRGDSALSKNAKSEFFHNLSMKALSEDENSVEMRFNHIGILCDNLKELLWSDRAVETSKTPLSLSFTEFTPPRFKSIKDRNHRTLVTCLSRTLLGKLKSKLERAARRKEGSCLLWLRTYNQEFSDGMIENTRKELWKNVANVDGSIVAEVISNLNKIGISNLKTGNKEAKRDYVQHIKSTVKKSNVNILSRVDEVQTVKP